MESFLEDLRFNLCCRRLICWTAVALAPDPDAVGSGSVPGGGRLWLKELLELVNSKILP
jgi:hypothetical protein